MLSLGAFVDNVYISDYIYRNSTTLATMIYLLLSCKYHLEIFRQGIAGQIRAFSKKMSGLVLLFICHYLQHETAERIIEYRIN